MDRQDWYRPKIRYGICDSPKTEKIDIKPQSFLSDEEIARSAFQKGWNAHTKASKDLIHTLKTEHNYTGSYWTGYRAALDDLKTLIGDL